MPRRKKNDFLKQGSILAAAGIITRLIGLLYRVPMTNLLGEEGSGLYGVAYGIYNIVLTLSSYSLPLAVSKLISQYSIKRQYKNAYRVFTVALLFALCTGTAACLGIYFGADFLELLYAREGLAHPLRVVAPTTFVMAVLGVMRGLFQGRETMIPTAISQILEQIVNAVVSIFAITAFLDIYRESAEAAAYGAAGGIVGTLAGALTALGFLAFTFFAYRPVLKRQLKRDRSAVRESGGYFCSLLFFTTVPVILSQTVYQIGYTIDDLLFGNIMKYKGVEDAVAVALLGVFNSQYNLLINVPVAIASAMASSTIPSIVALKSIQDEEGMRQKIGIVIKFNMVIAIPSSVGLAVLAKPILTALFPSLVTYRSLTANLLVFGSSAVVFYALSTITSAVLQGTNHMKLPVLHAAVSLALHVSVVASLLLLTDLGVYVLVLGNVTFPLVICLLNARSIHLRLEYDQEIKKTFLIPLLCSAIMGVTVFLINLLCGLFVKSLSIGPRLGTIFSLVLSMAFGIAAYFISLLAFNCFSDSEFQDLPFGRTIQRFLRTRY